MAGGGGGRSLEETPTWAVAVVCFVLLAISIVIEHIIHLIGKWLKKRKKRALFESLEKIKSELMLLGFISLMLTVLQYSIADICVSRSIADTWHPCNSGDENEGDEYGNANDTEEESTRRKLLMFGGRGGGVRRVLAGGGSSRCEEQNKVSFISTDGLHQLHIFIFVLALSHVLYCILTMALGRLKMKKWKGWEKETRTIEYQFSHDPERFRFARETSFGRRHMSFWFQTPFLLWIICFFRQFVRSVPKVDYLTLRHGFITAHLAPQSHNRFDFQKYINRSLEEDFKVVVGISPPIWIFAVLFLLLNTHGWYSYLWLPFIPLIVILLVGTKLQVIITKMGLRIQERGEVVKGVPVVQPADDLFWFNRPRLILYLINFVLFQNAFQLAFFAWTWFEFGFRNCFHERIEDIVIRITMGVLIQIFCSYGTLPLYALVTQMGSTMKPTIFNERVATALKNWHQTAKKHIKESKHSTIATPISSRPATPSRGTSPIHLLRYYKGEIDSIQTSPRKSNFDNWDTDDSPSPSPRHFHQGEGSSTSHHHIQLGYVEHEAELRPQLNNSRVVPLPVSQPPLPPPQEEQHEISIAMPHKEFSFDKRASV